MLLYIDKIKNSWGYIEVFGNAERGWVFISDDNSSDILGLTQYAISFLNKWIILLKEVNM